MDRTSATDTSENGRYTPANGFDYQIQIKILEHDEFHARERMAYILLSVLFVVCVATAFYGSLTGDFTGLFWAAGCFSSVLTGVVYYFFKRRVSEADVEEPSE